ncbi:hypothetical protein BN2475_70096 [Paraburkholderia ribeironis]|uniref:Uncharacterized protein n=1 Tax=Paraburkholderia ribeironis TaxID=1247936 RepID=A0A1N7RLY0_9BURK|nr:hypothetical protein BN2475_70096 [Paraburkholderia ribeironis]
MTGAGGFEWRITRSYTLTTQFICCEMVAAAHFGQLRIPRERLVAYAGMYRWCGRCWLDRSVFSRSRGP